VTAAGNTASDRPLVAGRGGGGPPASRVEVMATVILTLAAVATAWSAYQASRWHGEHPSAPLPPAGVGCAVLIGALAWAATLPVSS
jgi:hypothetical protein